jgi:hypothetical protein
VGIALAGGVFFSLRDLRGIREETDGGMAAKAEIRPCLFSYSSLVFDVDTPREGGSAPIGSARGAPWGAFLSPGATVDGTAGVTEPYLDLPASCDKDLRGLRDSWGACEEDDVVSEEEGEVVLKGNSKSGSTTRWESDACR